MGELRIRLLGGLEIACDGVAARPPLTRKARALLAYLALQGGRGQSREKLSELLWADSAEDQARASLRQTLSSLRKSLHGNDHLVAEGDRITLDPDGIELDVAAFERAVAEATPTALKHAAAL